MQVEAFRVARESSFDAYFLCEGFLRARIEQEAVAVAGGRHGRVQVFEFDQPRFGCRLVAHEEGRVLQLESWRGAGASGGWAEAFEVPPAVEPAGREHPRAFGYDSAHTRLAAQQRGDIELPFDAELGDFQERLRRAPRAALEDFDVVHRDAAARVESRGADTGRPRLAEPRERGFANTVGLVVQAEEEVPAHRHRGDERECERSAEQAPTAVDQFADDNATPFNAAGRGGTLAGAASAGIRTLREG